MRHCTLGNMSRCLKFHWLMIPWYTKVVYTGCLPVEVGGRCPMHSAPVPILDWKRRRPTQRNHLPKKPSRKCPTKSRFKKGDTLRLTGWLAKSWPWLVEKLEPAACSSFLLSSTPHRPTGRADAGLLASAAAAALVKVGETWSSSGGRPCS